MQRRILVVWLALFGGPALCVAQALFVAQAFSAEPAGPRPVTIDDFFSLATIGEAALSPDGSQVAYVEARWQKSNDDRKSEIWLVPASGRPATRITSERADYADLKWSGDGRHLYFTARRKRAGETAPPLDGKKQVWRIPAAGGEPTPVTQVPEGIESYDFLDEGRAVVYTTSRKETIGSFPELRKQFEAVRYSDSKSVLTQLWSLDLQTWRARQLVELKLAVDELAAAPRGTRVALITTRDGSVAELEGKSHVTIFDTKTSEVTQLDDELWHKQAPSPYGQLHAPTWNADGKLLAVSGCFDAYPSELYVAQWTDAAQPRSIKKLSLGSDVTLNGGVGSPPRLAWRGNSDDLCFVGQDHGRQRVYCLPHLTAAKETPRETLTAGDVVVDWFSLSQKGNQLAAVQGDPQRMADVHLYQDGRVKALTQANAHTADWQLPKVSVFQWKGAGGVPVEGILELPANHKPGTPLPTIINLHGGPTSAVMYRLQYTYLGNVLYSSQGYAVLSPNYRGSTGYGDKFLIDLVGHENQVEVEDILAGVEALIKAGIADRERLGVSGWSNGGYLTNCLISKTQLFKAASSGAGFVDTVQEWGTNDEPAYPVVFFGGLPWQKPDVYRQTSPLFQFGNVKTPTIFHVGENDVRCPPPNSEIAYRAIKLYSDTPTELLIYPGEPHGLGHYKSREAKMTWDLAWFDKYVKNAAKSGSGQ